MNRFSLYILLIFIYLGLSKSYSPTDIGTAYIEDEKTFSSFFPGAPLTIILQKSFEKGFLIKTYYHKYLVFDVFTGPETMIVRTSKNFWKKNKENQGLSLFSRKENDFSEILTPTVPGHIFIGDPSFGQWESSDKNQKLWVFHRPYRQIPHSLFWGSFIPSENFFRESQNYISKGLIFRGFHNEFGTEGEVTKTLLGELPEKAKINKIKFWHHFKSFWTIPLKG